MPPKKEEVKSSGPFFFSQPDPFVEIVLMILTFLVIIYLLNGILALITSSGFSPFTILNQLESFLTGNSWQIWLIRILLILVSVVCIVLMIDIANKLKKFREEDHKRFYPDMPTAPAPVNPKWQQILNHSESPNENDWRQAIIEADIMLDGLLKNMSLPGDTIGDKLKAVNRGDFQTLDNAWEAHKIRNQIAHDGSAFVLTSRTARETISNYEAVFNEFKII
jgi:uncharacterized membrane protein